jgi:hypothetical protein
MRPSRKLKVALGEVKEHERPRAFWVLYDEIAQWQPARWATGKMEGK